MGKDWASPFFPLSLIFRSFYWLFLLLVYVTLSLYLNIYERPIPKRESSFQSNKIIGTSSLWCGESLGGPILSLLQNVLIYIFISILNYAALSLHLNTNVWPVPKRESSFQTNKFVGTSTLSGGERLGRPNLSPPQKCSYHSIYLFSLLDYATLWMYLNTFEWPIPKWELCFLSYKFIGTSTLWGGERLAGPFFPSSKMYWSIYLSFSLLNYAALSLHLNTNVWPVPKRESSFQTNKFVGTSTLSGGEILGRPNLSPLKNVSIVLFIFSVFWIMQLFECIWTLLNDLFQSENYVFYLTSLLVLLLCGVGKDWAGPFFPPLRNVSIFQFIVLSFGLCYSLTVSEQFWMTYSKERSIF